MRGFSWALVLAAMLVQPGFADAPANSPRPRPDPQAQTVQIVTAGLAFPLRGGAEVPLEEQAALLGAAMAGPAESIRPRERPGLPAAAPAQPVAAPDAQVIYVVMALVSVPRPQPRPRMASPVQVQPEQPEQIEPAAAVRILPGKPAVKNRKGSVCGDPSIQGETLAPITSRVKGCGIENPVRVTSVDGVKLSQSAIINCDTARALKQWVKKGLKPAFGRKEVVSLRIAASYACRPRNNVRGAKISEHGRGNAIDISMITLANGKTVSVANDWRKPAGKPMKKAYRAACGTFQTTLGPDSDRYHRDHLHFDIARQRGGPFCR